MMIEEIQCIDILIVYMKKSVDLRKLIRESMRKGLLQGNIVCV